MENNKADMIEKEAIEFAHKTCLFKKNKTDAYYDVSINARTEAYIAGRSKGIEREKELEGELRKYLDYEPERDSRFTLTVMKKETKQLLNKKQ